MSGSDCDPSQDGLFFRKEVKTTSYSATERTTNTRIGGDRVLAKCLLGSVVLALGALALPARTRAEPQLKVWPMAGGEGKDWEGPLLSARIVGETDPPSTTTTFVIGGQAMADDAAEAPSSSYRVQSGTAAPGETNVIVVGISQDVDEDDVDEDARSVWIQIYHTFARYMAFDRHWARLAGEMWTVADDKGARFGWIQEGRKAWRRAISAIGSPLARYGGRLATVMLMVRPDRWTLLTIPALLLTTSRSIEYRIEERRLELVGRTERPNAALEPLVLESKFKGSQRGHVEGWTRRNNQLGGIGQIGVSRA